MLVCAHRGAFHDEPALDENSLPAFKRAIDFKCDYIEFDVHRSYDGKLVVFHNDQVVSNGHSIEIKTSNWEGTLENIRLPITNEPLPLFEQVLGTCKGKIKMNIEIKDPIIGKQVVDMITSFGIDLSDYIISSFHESVMKDVFDLRQGITTGFLFLGNFCSIKNAKIAMKYSCKAINPYYRFLNGRLVRYAQRNNLDIHTWTVNGDKLQDFIQKPFLTSIITNDVLLALELRDKYFPRKE